MTLKYLSLFFLFLLPIGTSAQYKQMLHKPYKDKAATLEHLYNTIAKGKHDSSFVVAYTKKMKQWALKKKDKELALEADLLKAYYTSYLSKKNPETVKDPKSLKELIKIGQKAQKQNLIYIQERATYGVALGYWWANNYEKAFEWLMHTSMLLQKMKPRNFPFMAMHVNFIGRCYYYFKDYKKALHFYKKAANLTRNKFNALQVLNAKNTVGLCYQKMGNLSLAKQEFLKIIGDTSTYQSPVWKNIASGNLGYNYYLLSDYDKALPLFKKDIRGALKIKDYGLAAGSAIPLAAVYLKQHKFKKSKQKIEEARKYIQTSGQTDRLRKLYPVMSNWFAANNKNDSSAVYLDSAIVAVKNYNKKYNALKLMRAHQQFAAEQRTLKIDKLKTESRLKLSQRNLIIIIVVILFMGSLTFYWSRNKYLLKKQQVEALALENTQKALTNAKTQLENLRLKIQQDTRLIRELQKEKKSPNTQHLLSQLRSKNILTQHDWIQYQALFSKVYPNFLSNLNTTYPALTAGERRCLCLLKLQLENKEVALLLGISTNTVMVTHYRIRKKLKLKNQKKLQELIQNLSTEV